MLQQTCSDMIDYTYLGSLREPVFERRCEIFMNKTGEAVEIDGIAHNCCSSTLSVLVGICEVFDIVVC